MSISVDIFTCYAIFLILQCVLPSLSFGLLFCLCLFGLLFLEQSVFIDTPFATLFIYQMFVFQFIYFSTSLFDTESNLAFPNYHLLVFYIFLLLCLLRVCLLI